MQYEDHKSQLGMMFPIEHAPEYLPDYARRVEAAGFDELWLAEDCFLNAGISAAATALAVTETLKVGVGIMPAVVRNPVFTAMEIATLSRLSSGRFLPGLGHGVARWMHQIGVFPPSQMKAMEEVAVAVRCLLHGETVNMDGQQVSLKDARLAHPPDPVPPLSLGAIGPKSLALSGRIGDGTIIPEMTPPAFVRWALQQIDTGRVAANRQGKHRLTVYAWCAVDPDSQRALARARTALVSLLSKPHTEVKLNPLGIVTELQQMMATGGQAYLHAHVPDAWIEQLGVFGDPHLCLAAIDRYFEAGVNTLVLFPLPGQEHVFLNEVVEHLVPTLES